MKNNWRFQGNEEKYLREVLFSDTLSSTSGSMNHRFEETFAQWAEQKYAVCFNSGTSALHAALHACDVNYGDEVIIPPITVISNADVCFAQNAVPVFADVDEGTFNIDPTEISARITDRTKAIMPVNIYGLSAELEKISAIARSVGVPVISDAAEAFGATCDGKNINKLADITVYSLENTKHISTGDGGIAVTDNEHYASQLRKFCSLSYSNIKAGDGRVRLIDKRGRKNIFQDPDYSRHDDVGLNYRMPELAAAVGLAQIERVEEFICKRETAARLLYTAQQDCEWLKPQKEVSGYRNAYWTFAIYLDHPELSWHQFRDKFQEYGGNGPFACWQITYFEEMFLNKAYVKRAPSLYRKFDWGRGTCPIAERIQPKLLQFPTNDETETEAEQQATALRKTIEFFS